MTANLLWKRVEEARVKWQRAHQHVVEINEHDAATPDGSYAHHHSIHVESLAVKNYHRALQEVQAAVAPKAKTESADSLTPREREVLALIASGKSSKEIAEQLGISFKTVVCHRYRCQTKLQAHNTADLTRAAIRLGLIEVNLSDSDVPVIFSSAHYDAMNCRRATDAGASAFFQKPFRASDLLTAIETAVKNQSDEPGDRSRSR